MAGDLVRRVDRPGRVGRRHEEQDLGPVGARRLQVRHRGQVAGVLVGQHRPHHAARQRDGLGVGRPVGGGHQDLVARVEQGGERLVHRLLAAVGHQHLAGFHPVARVPSGLGRDRLAELGQAGGGGVLVETRLLARPLGGLDDVTGRREVRLPGAEADDRPARRLQRLGLGVHGQRGGFGDSGDACGDSGWHGLHCGTRRPVPRRDIFGPCRPPPAWPRSSTRGPIGRTLLEPAAELSFAAACPSTICVCREAVCA